MPSQPCTAADHTHCQLASCSTAYAAMLDGRMPAMPERDRLASTLAEVLAKFGYRRTVGNTPCMRTGWIWEDDVNRWRRALHDNASPLATPATSSESESDPLPGAVPVTPDEMIDLLGAALGLAQRQTAEQAARADRLEAENAALLDLRFAARRWRAQFEKPADTKPPRMAALISAVDALPPQPRVHDETHPWQEYNAHGNTCHYPGCRLQQEEHRYAPDGVA